MMANSTGGAQYPGASPGGNTAQGTGSTRPKPHKPPKPKSHNPKPNKPRKPKAPPAPSVGPFNAQNYGQALPYGQALDLAKLLSGQQYNGAIASQRQLIANTPDYFNRYRAAIINAQGQTNALSQPYLAQAGQAAQNTGQTLGLGGPAAADDALAAASRAQQATAMSQALQGLANANNNYFNQTAANSYGAQATALQQAQQGLATLRGQRGAATASNLQNIRTGDREYGLEVKTLLGNQAADRAKARNDAAATRAATRKAQNDFLAKNGVSQQTWRHMTPKERVAWKREWNRSQQSPSDKLDAARLKYFRQHGYFPPTGPGGGSNGKDQFGNTQRQRDSANSGWKKARAKAGELAGAFTDDKGKYHPPIKKWRDVYQLLLDAPGTSTLNSDVLTVAAMRATGTHIPSSLMKSLRRQGVDVAQIRNPAGGRSPGRSGATGNTPPGGGGRGPASGQRPT